MKTPVFICNLTSLIIAIFACLPAGAETYRDSVLINFRQSKILLDTTYMDNANSFDHIRNRIDYLSCTTPPFVITGVEVVGAASPEGSVRFNEWLSHRRAEKIFDYVDRRFGLPDSLSRFSYAGRDWNGTLAAVIVDRNVPYRDDVIDLLRYVVNIKEQRGEKESDRFLENLKQLHGGVPYRYLYRNIFPKLRVSKLVINYESPQTETMSEAEDKSSQRIEMFVARDTVIVHDTVYIERVEYYCPPCKPFYMDIRTNLLMDAVTVPNIGVEFYLGKRFSIVGNWHYAWWSTDRRHRYLRTYGGQIELRRWFGNARKPLSGHHMGLYAGILTYDFEWGGTGHMGGTPTKNLWNRCNWFCGIEYGYSIALKPRLSLDLSLGLGYLGGTYHTYDPDQSHYVWRSTHERHFFGPTKAAVSLVWLIGCDNVNRQKGGRK